MRPLRAGARAPKLAECPPMEVLMDVPRAIYAAARKYGYESMSVSYGSGAIEVRWKPKGEKLERCYAMGVEEGAEP